MANFSNLVSQVSGAGPSPTQITSVEVTHAQLTSAVGFDLLPPPGSNKNYLIEGMSLYADGLIEIVDIDFTGLTGSNLVGNPGSAAYVTLYDTSSNPAPTIRNFYFDDTGISAPANPVSVGITSSSTAAQICTAFKSSLDSFNFPNLKITDTYLRVISSIFSNVQQGLLPDISTFIGAQASVPNVSVKRKGSVVASPYVFLSAPLTFNIQGFTTIIDLSVVRQTTKFYFINKYTNLSNPLNVKLILPSGGPEGNIYFKIYYKTYESI